MTPQAICAPAQSPKWRLRLRPPSASLAALLTVLICVGGCSGGSPDTNPGAAAPTTAPAAAITRPASAPATTSAAPLPAIGTTTIGGKRYRLELYKLPEKVDLGVWATIESILTTTPDGVITVVDIEKPTGEGSVMPDPGVVRDIAGHRDRLAVLTQPVQAKDPPPNPLGDVGSLIFALANYRFSDHATSSAVREALIKAKPTCGDACQKLPEDPAAVKDGFYPLSWQPFADAVLTTAGSETTRTATSTATTPGSAPPSPSGEGGSTLPWIIVGVLATILLAGIALVLRGPLAGIALVLRGPLAGRPDPDVPSGGRAGADPARGPSGGQAPRPRGGQPARQPPPRTVLPPTPSTPRVARVHLPDIEVGQRGLVHSEFRETGYVSVDGALYRAVWKGSEQSRPRIGDSVALYADRGDGLQAWPLAPSDDHRRRPPVQ